MDRIARFEKVSRDRFIKDYMDVFGNKDMDQTWTKALEEEASKAYDEIKIPVRATSGSAGYDICTPFDITVLPGHSVKIPTGIRVTMREDYCLFIMPRSGLGSKFRFQLNNTTGVIDSDYYFSENEGHIFVPMINDSRDDKTVTLKSGSAFAQGVFCSFGITEDDDAKGLRDGGFGSTG